MQFLYLTDFIFCVVKQVETLEEELASQTQLVLKLKDGTRLGIAIRIGW